MPAVVDSSTSDWTRARPGAGTRLAALSSPCRSIPSIRRISASAVRLLVSIVASARSAASGSVRSRSSPTLDWTAMEVTECATTSCSSRAIRSRSASTARLVTAALSASSRAARSA